MFFSDIPSLERRIANYFDNCQEQQIPSYIHPADSDPSEPLCKMITLPPGPPTLCGLILHLGFDSRATFEAKARKSKFAVTLRRARLRIEAEYEQKLHKPSPTGAIFALKNMGCNDNKDSAQTEKPTSVKFKVDIAPSPTIPAGSERDVLL